MNSVSIFTCRPKLETTLSLGNDAISLSLVKCSQLYPNEDIYLPFTACMTRHCNQKFSELPSKVILVRLEIPANTFGGRCSQIKGKLLQAC